MLHALYAAHFPRSIRMALHPRVSCSEGYSLENLTWVTACGSTVSGGPRSTGPFEVVPRREYYSLVHRARPLRY